MLRIFVSMGSGGTGKTSFVALMTKYLVEAGERPLHSCAHAELGRLSNDY